MTQDADRAAVAGVVETFFAAFVSGPDLDERMSALRAVFLPAAVIVRTCGDEPVCYDVDGFLAPRAALLAGDDVRDCREWEIAGRGGWRISAAACDDERDGLTLASRPAGSTDRFVVPRRLDGPQPDPEPARSGGCGGVIGARRSA